MIFLLTFHFFCVTFSKSVENTHCKIIFRPRVKNAAFTMGFLLFWGVLV